MDAVARTIMVAGEYVPPIQPWEHQTRALARARDREFFAYLMEMGTGKTKVAIDEICELYIRGLVDAALIFAPKGVYMNWVRKELPEHVHPEILEQALVVHWMPGGGNKEHQGRLVSLLEPQPGLRILVMNIEAVSVGSRGVDFARDFLTSSWPRNYMVVDESTFIKTPSAQRTKNVVSLGDSARYRRIMTGAPVPRGPLDIFSQADFLKPGLLGVSWYAFRARYAVMKNQRFGSRKVKVVVGYRNIEELNERIQPWSFRVTKDECLDLPAKIYQLREVEMTPEQESWYAQLRDFAFAELDQETTVSSSAVIVQMLRLQQMLCGHVTDDNGELREVPTRRVDALVEVCQEAPGKVIIWSRFRHDVEVIVARLRKEFPDTTVAQFHGGNVTTRHIDAERFVNDPDCRWMVATYAGGHGNTWIVADTVVYYSNDFDLEKRMQSEDRAHRAGQTRHVTYVDLCVRNTVDERIIDALRRKINIAAAVVGDGYREWLR